MVNNTEKWFRDFVCEGISSRFDHTEGMVKRSDIILWDKVIDGKLVTLMEQRFSKSDGSLIVAISNDLIYEPLLDHFDGNDEATKSFIVMMLRKYLRWEPQYVVKTSGVLFASWTLPGAFDWFVT